MNKRRILALVLTFAMLFALAAPVMASGENGGPEVSAWLIGNGNNAALEITVNGVTASNLPWSNNNSRTYEVNGYNVTVFVRGGTAVVQLVVAAAMPEEYAPVVLDEIEEIPEPNSPTPSNNQTAVDPETRFWRDGFGFHCNTFGGNGRTAVTINGQLFRANNQNDNGRNPLMHSWLDRVGMTTTWTLRTLTDIVCETCGSMEWITYSNNSGVINGRNIQANHPPAVATLPAAVIVSKVWLDANGAPFNYDGEITFTNGFVLGENTVPANELADFSENIPEGWNFVSVSVNDNEPETTNFVTINPAPGGTYNVVFTNQLPLVYLPDGFEIEKTVEGESFPAWLAGWAAANPQLSVEELLAGMTFKAFALDYEGQDFDPDGVPAAFGALNPNTGMIVFPPLELGLYAIVEVLTGLAAEVFEAVSHVYFWHAGAVTFAAGIFSSYWEDSEGFAQAYAVDATDYTINEARAEAARLAAVNRETFPHIGPDGALLGIPDARPTNQHVHWRRFPSNSFGAPNAVQSSAVTQLTNSRIAGLRFLNNNCDFGTTPETDGVTYWFGPSAEETRYIYRHPDPNVVDLSLIEVTWRDDWHLEAVDLYLVNAKLTCGTVEPLHFIGTVYNNQFELEDIILGERIEGANGFSYEFSRDQRFIYTDIYFPYTVIRADAVRLVDVTSRFNYPRPTFRTYYMHDDGYDLDAMIAWFTTPVDPPLPTFDNTLRAQQPAGADDEVRHADVTDAPINPAEKSFRVHKSVIE
jgi:hypothetical protein